MTRTVVIAGAGPAGLTAALEMLRRSDCVPLVFEADTQVGGISKTVNYRGNRMDLGGHRFFSKSDWVMNWWQEILPVIGHRRRNCKTAPGVPGPDAALRGGRHCGSRATGASCWSGRDLSRIYYRRQFFDYPAEAERHACCRTSAGSRLRCSAAATPGAKIAAA